MFRLQAFVSLFSRFPSGFPTIMCSFWNKSSHTTRDFEGEIGLRRPRFTICPSGPDKTRGCNGFQLLCRFLSCRFNIHMPPYLSCRRQRCSKAVDSLVDEPGRDVTTPLLGGGERGESQFSLLQRPFKIGGHPAIRNHW